MSSHPLKIEAPLNTGPFYRIKGARFFAWLFSIVFHPLFIPLYVTYYLSIIHPRYFEGFNHAQRLIIVIRVAINMVVYPLIAVALLKGVGFIDSVLLRTQKDRVIPYVASGIFFFWMYLVFRNQTEIPSVLTSFIFGVFLASSAALIANIYCKVSMHAIGSGGLVGIATILFYIHPASPDIVPFMTSILICGIICSARLLISDHSQKEIYLGFFLGLTIQIISAFFLL